MKENLISLRIFSGAHIGAEIDLPECIYVFGSDDSCDIILHDQNLKARHIQLKIERIASLSTNTDSTLQENIESDINEQDGNEQAVIDVHSIKVQIQNLDGTISLYGEILENESFLEARTPYYMGQTCFAWTQYGAFDYSWNTVSENIQKSVAHIGTKSDAFNENFDKNAESVETINSQDTENSHQDSNRSDDLDIDAKEVASEIANDVGENTYILPYMNKAKWEKAKQIIFYQNKKWWRYALYFTALLLVLSLSVTVKQSYTLIPSNLILLEKSLGEQGFSHLTIFEDESGITLSGILKDDTERAKIVRLAQNMHFPVYLDIKIQDDLLESLEAAYNGQGFYPEITILTEENQIRISGYVKDKLVLHVIDTYVQNNIPALKNQTIQYIVYYADELQELLAPRINAANLDFFNIQYLLGTLGITVDFTEENKKIFDEIMNTISLELKIPIIVDATSVMGKQLQRLQAAEDAQESKQNMRNQATSTEREIFDELAGMNNNGKDGAEGFMSQQQNPAMPFEVSSVTLDPIKYVILSTGERVFEGGLLAGNYILENISLKELTLNDKNGIISTYKLK